MPHKKTVAPPKDRCSLSLQGCPLFRGISPQSCKKWHGEHCGPECPRTAVPP